MFENVWTFFDSFIRAFVPLFVAVDAFGLLPIYVGLTGDLDSAQRRKVLRESIITALLICIGFIFFGQVLFSFMGITSEDFKIAGGLLLFVLSTLDIISGIQVSRRVLGSVGAVPLGTPLIAGPAVLTTSVILVGSFGLVQTVLSLIANIALAWAVLSASTLFTRLLGSAGSRALSKVSNLILAAFAVMMIRQGVMTMIGQAR